MFRLSFFLQVSLLVLHPWMCHADVLVTIPSAIPSTNIVYSNFLGISIELSFMDQYCELIYMGAAKSFC